MIVALLAWPRRDARELQDTFTELHPSRKAQQTSVWMIANEEAWNAP